MHYLSKEGVPSEPGCPMFVACDWAMASHALVTWGLPSPWTNRWINVYVNLHFSCCFGIKLVWRIYLFLKSYQYKNFHITKRGKTGTIPCKRKLTRRMFIWLLFKIADVNSSCILKLFHQMLFLKTVLRRVDLANRWRFHDCISSLWHTNSINFVPQETMELVRDSVEDNLTVDVFVTAAAKVTETVVLRYFQVRIHFQGHILSYFRTTNYLVMNLVLLTFLNTDALDLGHWYPNLTPLRALPLLVDARAFFKIIFCMT